MNSRIQNWFNSILFWNQVKFSKNSNKNHGELQYYCDSLHEYFPYFWKCLSGSIKYNLEIVKNG